MVKKTKNLYPWLIDHYKNIITKYAKTYKNQAIIFRTMPGLGINNLIEALVCWIMCKKCLDHEFCTNCYDCRMVQNKNHPNCYILKSEKDTIGVDEIRLILEKLTYSVQKNAAKIVWLPNASHLTEEALNAMLKALEQPFKNHWFFLVNYKKDKLPLTLRSRCIQWRISIPNKKISIQWLKTKKLKKDSEEILNIALRLSNGAPKAAYKLIQKKWDIRHNFFESFSIIFEKKIFSLLKILNNNMAITYIYWLYTFFFDIIVFRYKIRKYITNIDKILLIRKIEKIFSLNELFDILDNWKFCYFDLKNLSRSNHELVLTKYLLNFENILYRKK